MIGYCAVIDVVIGDRAVADCHVTALEKKMLSLCNLGQMELLEKSTIN